MPIGPALTGVLLGAFGPSRAILVYGSVYVALALVATLTRALRDEID